MAEIEQSNAIRLTYDEAESIAQWLHVRIGGIIGKGDVEGLTDLVQIVVRRAGDIVAAREDGQ